MKLLIEAFRWGLIVLLLAGTVPPVSASQCRMFNRTYAVVYDRLIPVEFSMATGPSRIEEGTKLAEAIYAFIPVSFRLEEPIVFEGIENLSYPAGKSLLKWKRGSKERFCSSTPVGRSEEMYWICGRDEDGDQLFEVIEASKTKNFGKVDYQVKLGKGLKMTAWADILKDGVPPTSFPEFSRFYGQRVHLKNVKSRKFEAYIEIGPGGYSNNDASINYYTWSHRRKIKSSQEKTTTMGGIELTVSNDKQVPNILIAGELDMPRHGLKCKGRLLEFEDATSFSFGRF